MKPEIDWLKEDPAFTQAAIEGSLKSEDYLSFIRAIRLELLDHIYELAADEHASKSKFLYDLSKLKREWEIQTV